MSAVYTRRNHNNKRKDGPGVRGSAMASIVDAAFDDAKTASDALATAEGRGGKKRRNAKDIKTKEEVKKKEEKEPEETKEEAKDNNKKKKNMKIASSSTIISNKKKTKEDENEKELEETVDAFMANILEYEDAGVAEELAARLVNRIILQFPGVSANLNSWIN